MTNELAELTAQLEAVRIRLSALRSEMDEFSVQIRSREEVHAQVLQQVATWRAQASAAVALDLQRMLAGQSVPLLEMRTINGTIQLGPMVVMTMGEESMVSWLTSLTNQLPKGLDTAQRADRMEHIGRELRLAEAAEEALLREADDLGYPLDPRADARPQAALLVGWGDA